MGKDSVVLRDTRERLHKEKNTSRGAAGSKVQKVSKKNISKKDADLQRRAKAHEKQIQKDTKQQEKQKSMALKKLQNTNLSLAERKAKILAEIKEKRKNKRMQEEDDEWQDVDEHEKEVYATTGYFDVPEVEAHISKHDQQLLQKMEKNTLSDKQRSEGVNLADIIMQKLATGDYEDGDKLDSKSQLTTAKGDLDPKVIEAYKKVGVVMKSFKSGKLPKAFKIIPQTANWEELLFLTSPDTWSPHSTYAATKIFASQLSGKLAQRFFNIILLPNVRANIAQYKKLNYHLYMAVKKAMFKIGAFFKGFLLPLAEDASTREAIIIGSILQKMSINALDVAAALVKMTSYDYKLGNGYFIKVLLAKRYTLPTIVLDALVNFFCRSSLSSGAEPVDEEGSEDKMDDEEALPSEMPVMWHQTVLALVQNYKSYFSIDQRKKIQQLIKVQTHYAITPEIKRELSHMDMSEQRKRNQD